MRTKKFLLIGLSAMMLSACGSSASGDGSGLFGEIPGIYRSEFKKIADDVKEIQKEMEKGNSEEAMKALELMAQAAQKATEQSTPIAEAMVGKSIECTMSEAVPCKVVDFKVTKVKLPKFEFANLSDLTLKADLTVVMTDTLKSAYLKFCYLLSDGKEDFKYGWISMSNPKISMFEDNPVMLPGDTLTTQLSIYEPSIPLALINRCNLIRFIANSEYEAVGNAIESKKKQWKLDAEKDWE